MTNFTEAIHYSVPDGGQPAKVSISGSQIFDVVVFEVQGLSRGATNTMINFYALAIGDEALLKKLSHNTARVDNLPIQFHYQSNIYTAVGKFITTFKDGFVFNGSMERVSNG